tara:strand:+ start:8 stop:508 length:501 start_codon:yes stop_codon:yes gene_type:complete
MNIKQYIQLLPKDLQKKIYIYCFKKFWKEYIPLTAKVPSWYERKNKIEKIIFDSKINNIHFLHLPFNTLPENKEWIMGCQCSYCIKVKKKNRKRKYHEYEKQFQEPYYFESIMPKSDLNINNDDNYDPLCGSIFEESNKYALRTNKIKIEFMDFSILDELEYLNIS